SLSIAPHRLREGDNRYVGPSETTLRWPDLCRELDRRHRSRSASRHVSSEKGSTGRIDVVLGELRQSAACRLAAGGVLLSGKAGARGWRSGQSTGISAA